ncbi:hypothetical protein QEN19_003487 [Hanseniaspora menglaensis]
MWKPWGSKDVKSDKNEINESVVTPIELIQTSEQNHTEIKSIEQLTGEYKDRRRTEMLRFMGVSMFTLIVARYTYTSIQARKYVPKLFEGNQKIPPSAYKSESMSALGLGTGLAVGSFGMLVYGTCWCNDILTPKEFSFKIRRAILGEQGAKDLEAKHQELFKTEEQDIEEFKKMFSEGWSEESSEKK